MSTFNVGESAICTDSQNWYCGKIVRICSVNVFDGITIYGVAYGNIEFALRESGLGKISLRDQIDALSSPVARQLLGNCYDAMQDAVLDRLSEMGKGRSGLTGFAKDVADSTDFLKVEKMLNPAESAEVDYISQERELRILIYTRQVEQTGKVDFIK